jgi:hypothetical protein
MALYDPYAPARWEKYARMRLGGGTDMVHSNYDLLAPKYDPIELKWHLIAAGISGTYIHETEPLMELQRRFIEWGYGVRTLAEVRQLLREYYVYKKVMYDGHNRCPYRDPDETRRLVAAKPAQV